MNKNLPCGVFLLAATSITLAQTVGQFKSEYVVSERETHHRVWPRITLEANAKR
jgi:hypothetical protein